MYVDVEKQRRENRPLRYPIPQSSEPSALATAGLEDEAAVGKCLHDELHHVLVRELTLRTLLFPLWILRPRQAELAVMVLVFCFWV